MSGTGDVIHVLHVDDEPDFADMAAKFLERENERIDVQTATSPTEGMDILADHDVDCIVSDYDMPHTNGIEFLETVREEYPDLPFILFTGKGSEAVASDAISAGVTDYLQKEHGTGQYAVLANRIANAVKQFRSQRELEASQQRLSLFIEQSPLGVLEYDSEFTIVGANAAAEEILGYSEMELQGETWEKIVAGSSYEDVDEVTSALAEAEGGFHSVDENVRRDGTHIVCEWHNRVVTDDSGDVVAVFSLFQDITEREERQGRLERTTARLEALFENSPDMIDIHTADGTIVDVNRQFCEVFGRSKDELVGRKVWDIDQERDPDELRDIWADMEIGDRIELETEFRHEDGEFPAEVHVTRLPIDDGDRFMVISREITERKERLREINDLKERLEFAIEGANLGVWDWDMRTDEVDFNEQWATMLGYTLDDIDPHLDAWQTRVHPADLDEVTAALEAHVEEETAYYDTEHRMRTANGEWKWIRDIGRIFERDDDGEPIRAVGIHLDIDERKERERELERQTEALEKVTARLEKQYRTLFEEAPVMAVITRAEDGQPVIEDCNEQFAATLGYEEVDVVGRDLAAFYTANAREQLLDAGGYERALSGVFTKERRELLTADGETVETLLRAVPHRDASGDTVGTLAMYIDITEREQVKRANERLEEFTSIVSHDLRNPLSVAEGRLALAREECDSEYLDDIKHAHDRMITLIDDLLRLAREGEQVGTVERIAPDDMVRACWENVVTGDATLVAEFSRPLRADPSRLQQLLENLLRNAVEHGTTGNQTTSDDAVEHGTTGNRAASDDAVEHGGEGVTVTVGELDDGFYVADDGPGIPTDERDAVFEAGYSTRATGTGFGLSIVEQIVEAHGWEINVTEGTEGGARFEITGVEFVTE